MPLYLGSSEKQNINFMKTILNAIMTASNPIIPDTPTAAQYLYGHIAESTVSYNGVTLPDIESVWTDKESYPDAVIYLKNGVYKFAFGQFYSPYIYYGEYCFQLSHWVLYTGTDEGWIYDTKGYSTLQPSVSTTTVIWTTHDLYDNEKMSTIYLAASEPVYTYDPDVIVDGVGYVGAVLPNIDAVYTDELKQTHPYAVIQINDGDFAQLTLRQSWEQEAKEGYGEIVWYQTGDIYHKIDISADSTATEWGEAVVYQAPTFGAGMMCTISSIDWTNTDIVSVGSDSYSVGELILAATEPVPVYNGLVGYSYNGTVLPELPEIEDYPCLYMYCDKSDGYYRVLYTATAFKATDSSGGVLSVSQIGATRMLRDGKWVSGGTHSYLVYKKNTTGFEWTNTEILYDDGTIYLEATEPIPVYEV